MNRKGVKKGEKNLMLLSAETRMGLQMAGNGTISRYIFTSLNSVRKTVWSEGKQDRPTKL